MLAFACNKTLRFRSDLSKITNHIWILEMHGLSRCFPLIYPLLPAEAWPAFKAEV